MADTDGVFQSIDRSSIVDSIIEQFQKALITRELQPGQRLPSEAELCKRLGVGRSSLREALKALAAIGVVEVRRGDGTYISEQIAPEAIMPLLFAILVETESPAYLQEFRFMFDSGYLKLAAHNADDNDFDEIEQQIQNMTQYIAEDGRDPEVLARLDLDFHVAVMKATKNPLILKVGQLLNTMLFDLIKRNMAAPGAADWTVKRHWALLDILKRRASLEVEETMATSAAGLRRVIDQAQANYPTAQHT